MDITIVICTHNREALLRQTLLRLSHAQRASDASMDILVVANACNDGTPAFLATTECDPIWNDLPLRWISELTPGKSYALNRAIAETDADALCFIDDDQFVASDFLPALVKALAENPEYDIICGKISPAWDGSEPAWVHETGRYHIPIRPFPEYDFGDAPKEIFSGHKLPSGGNITLRRVAFQQVGKFSAELGPQGHNLMGGEDIEFLQRCLAHGHRILYMPTLRQLHVIEQERMCKRYMLRKSYLRSFSSQRMQSSPHGLQPYMFLKLLKHGLNALLTLNASRRFYYLMRLAATFGELKASVKT
ncbi:glycosyltransferase family 2 protein [Thiocystis violascens]|uniref:Putative glycosyltransferase n=1 Tax=Thiocystis violascens (strain ATCC 17096 / DSM 198 / 6111) TaxID=765911 RepID=I3YFV9_THIV6|nr:glycosyltransferase [Thiocystis violascens]AFL75877.1 putative glycosyltransferase [Thiocystis violascens DSM 198]